MTKNLCPFCEKEFKDILKHIRFEHEVEDIEQIEEGIKRFKHRQKKQISCCIKINKT